MSTICVTDLSLLGSNSLSLGLLHTLHQQFIRNHKQHTWLFTLAFSAAIRSASACYVTSTIYSQSQTTHTTIYLGFLGSNSRSFSLLHMPCQTFTRARAYVWSTWTNGDTDIYECDLFYRPWPSRQQFARPQPVMLHRQLFRHTNNKSHQHRPVDLSLFGGNSLSLGLFYVSCQRLIQTHTINKSPPINLSFLGSKLLSLSLLHALYQQLISARTTAIHEQHPPFNLGFLGSKLLSLQQRHG